MTFNSLLKVNKHSFCWIILLSLLALQLLLFWRFNPESTQLFIQSIFLTGLFWKIYQKQLQLRLNSNVPANLLGITLILLLLFRAKYIFIVEASVFWYIFSLLSILGYILLIAGFEGFKRFRYEIIIFVLLTSPVLRFFSTFFLYLSQKDYFSVTEFSATLTSFLLWYVGFDSSVQGQIVYVNDGAIDIYFGCTGMPLFIELLRTAFLIAFVFPSLCRNLWLFFVSPLLISLILSIIRLAIMVLVVNDAEAFDFWHGIEGGNLFTTIGMLTFFSIILLTSPPQPEESSEEFGLALSKHQPQTPAWLLLFSSVALLIILLDFSVGSPVAGANGIADYELPKDIDLPGWQLERTAIQPLIPAKRDTEDENPAKIEFNFPLAQRSYFYRKSTQALEVNLRYITNTFGDVRSYYNDAFLGLPTSENYVQDKKDDRNSYLEFESEGRQYRTACINVKGKTTVTGQQFAADYRQDYLNATQFVNWLLGRRLLQDRRCLWIELSTVENSGLSHSEISQVWQELVYYWQSNFPPFRFP